MRTMNLLLRGIGVTALLYATPALAQSQIDKARTAVTEATAKVQAAETAGAATHAPEIMARAQEALRVAKDQLDRDHRDSTIQEAERASGLADQALAQAEERKAAVIATERDRRVNAEASATSAAMDAASERDQREAAERAALSASNDAQAARARAAEAQAAAAAAAAPTTTTVTVDRETTAAAPARTVAKKKTTVRRTATTKAKVAPAQKPATVTTTTTTVETKPN